MVTKIINFVKEHQNDIVLFIGVVLISLLSFAMGYIFAKHQMKEPIQIKESTNNESVSGLRMGEFVNLYIGNKHVIRS